MDGAGLHAIGLVSATQCKATLSPPLVATGQSTITPKGEHQDLSREVLFFHSGGGASVFGIQLTYSLLTSTVVSILVISFK